MAAKRSIVASSLLVVACGGSGNESAVGDAGDGGRDGGALVDAGGDDAAAQAQDAGAVTLSFAPEAIPKSEPELSNPLRGQYEWLGVPAYPASWPDVDGYMRYQWAELEPTHGNYQWALIDDQIAAANARHGRFGMRVMALCQGCGHHVYRNAQSSMPDDLADAVNSFVGTAPGDSVSYLIPDWNSDAYFARLQELLDAISARYKDDPHFAWVDVSSYGNWGEMHMYPFTEPGGPYDTSTQRPITDANAQRLVQMNAKAFANKLLVLNSENEASLAAAVASVSPPIGIRVDCLGSDGLAGGDVLDRLPGASDRWKTAPFITEWCQVNLGASGANLFVQGEAQVRQYHVSMLSSGNFTAKPTTAEEVAAFRAANVEAGYRLRVANGTISLDLNDRRTLAVSTSWGNDNVAPTYLAWRVMVGFRAGTVSVEAPLRMDLRSVLPGAPAAIDETVTLPSALAAGTYDVYLRVDDVQQVSPPMQLAMRGRDGAGAYALGSLAVP